MKRKATRFLALAMSAVLVISLTACGDGSDENAKDAVTPVEAQPMLSELELEILNLETKYNKGEFTQEDYLSLADAYNRAGYIRIEPVILFQHIPLLADIACSAVGICQCEVICSGEFSFIIFGFQIKDLQLQFGQHRLCFHRGHHILYFPTVAVSAGRQGNDKCYAYGQCQRFCCFSFHLFVPSVFIKIYDRSTMADSRQAVTVHH